MIEIFEEVEIEQVYDGYYYRVSEIVTIVVLGTLCGLKSVIQIHRWAVSESVSAFLKEKFGINKIPCYYWFLCLLKLVKPESLNKCLVKWVKSILPEDRTGLTISLDGKTVCSTTKMKSYKRPLHIVSAQLSELGFTFASKSVEGKSNEIPAVQELIEELDVQGCMVVADAMHCQKETAKVIVKGKGDYLLNAKGNQLALSREIQDYVQDDSLRKGMEKKSIREKNRDRIETRTAYVTTDISWLYGKEKWEKLTCIGAIEKKTEQNGKITTEWHYYISSRTLTPLELLHHARMEWRVETMHWLLDVHFSEDYCRVVNKTIQKNLNLLRKFALNLIRQFKEQTASKSPLSHIMLDCLIDCNKLWEIVEN